MFTVSAYNHNNLKQIYQHFATKQKKVKIIPYPERNEVPKYFFIFVPNLVISPPHLEKCTSSDIRRDITLERSQTI